MRIDDLLRSPKKKAVLLYIYGYPVFNTAENKDYAHTIAPEFIRLRMGSELFAELLLQLVLDGFIEQKNSMVPKSDQYHLISEFKTTVKGNKWIHSRLIDPISRDRQPTVEQLISGLLSDQTAASADVKEG